MQQGRQKYPKIIQTKMEKGNKSWYWCIFTVAVFFSSANTEDKGVPPRVHQIVIVRPIPIQNVVGRDKLILSCSASGNPAPDIHWTKDDVKFENTIPNNNISSGKIRHFIKGNKLTVINIDGYKDSGRYRCVATNAIGSVFLEKIIRIRVIGRFKSGAQFADPPIKLNPTFGRKYIIKCPPHTKGYGTSIKWGTVSSTSNIPSYWAPGRPSKRGFPMAGGRFAYAYVTRDDYISSRNVGGVRCILVNFGVIVASAQLLLWQPYKKVLEYRKPVLIQHMPKKMEALVNSRFKITCGATGYPLPKISWEYQGASLRSRWFNKTTELNFEFFRIAGNGHTLIITRITKYSGGTFKCYARNSLGLTWESGQLTVLFPPKMLHALEESYKVALESTWKFNCSASGNPEPKYEWYHNGTLLKADLRRTIKKGLLKIKKADYKDDGIYICIAINKVTSISISTFLKIKAMSPRFVVPLSNPVFVYEQSTMYIECHIFGGPLPKVTWSKDGISLKGHSRFSVRKDGALEIKQAKKDDLGMYMCTGENFLGSVKQVTELKLLKPTVITNPPQNLTFQVGWGYGTMFCGADYDENLDLRIEWYKAGVKMTKFDDRVYLESRAKGPPRLLYIHDFRITDAGVYSCHAYTKYGDFVSEQWAHGSIHIKGPPEPASGVRVIGDCLNYNARLTWHRGEQLGAEARRFYIEYATNDSASIGHWYGGQGAPYLLGKVLFVEPGTAVNMNLDTENLVPGANLVFRIRTASDHLVGRPSRQSKAGTCITPPGRPLYNPVNVTVVYDGPNTFIIWWLPVPKIFHGSTGFYYKVGHKRISATEFINITVSYDKNNLSIPDPGLDVEHEFFVQSVNMLGSGPKPKVHSARSATYKPNRTPQNVRVTMISMFSVEFVWQKMDGVTGYRITYWNTTDSESQRGFTPGSRKRRSVSTDPVMKYQYYFGPDYANGASLINITADQEHMATVAAINSGGIGPESTPIEFTTAQRIPEKPIRVVLYTFGESAKLVWNPPLHPGGFIEGYTISWYRADLHDRSVSGKIHTRAFTRSAREAYLVDVFEPMHYYNIRLYARNRVGQGLQWYKQLVAVSAPDIPGKPDIPICKAFDDTSINVTFQNSNYGGLPTKFRVVIRPRGMYYKEQTYYEQDFPERAWILVKRLDYIVYDIHCVGINPLGQSETSDVVEMRPIRVPKFNAHASPLEWWQMEWFIILLQTVVFVALLFATLFLLLKEKSSIKIYQENKTLEAKKKSTSGNVRSKQKSATILKPPQYDSNSLVQDNDRKSLSSSSHTTSFSRSSSSLFSSWSFSEGTTERENSSTALKDSNESFSQSESGNENSYFL